MAEDGKILVGKLALELAMLRNNVNEANKILGDIGKTSKKNADNVSKVYAQMATNMKKAIDKVDQAKKKVSDSSDVKKTAEQYRNLTTAIREYQRAIKSGNTEEQKYWNNRVTSAQKDLDLQRQKLDTFSDENNARQKINDIIHKGNNAMDAHNKKILESSDQTKMLAKQFDSIYGKLKLIAGISFAKMWYDALQYAKEFDKAITDIAIVTQVPIDQARALGKEYRQMANDLNVTSTSIATAAATIARQGITDQGEIKGVIEGVTKFGAVTDLSTDESIKVMTASMQNFRKETESAEDVVERIGDTWSYMGDAVATEGSDIAEAMGKASASVASVGLEFEKASAYAAVMLAKTQQSGQVIGTQLNSLVSRYAKITSKGYASVTEDDEGEALNFNDVSKALKTASIEIYDTAEKTFLPIGDMFDQLSEKWATLDEAQQKYIATTVGGTRGMNYFLTLMENYDEALLLQSEALENRGIVNEKYITWLQGAEAAQNNLTNSLESFYSLLEADYLTKFYNGLAGVVDVLTEGTDAMDGWNLKLPLIAGGVLLVVGAGAKLLKTLQDIRKAIAIGEMTKMAATSTLLSGNIGLIIGAVTLLAAGITKLWNVLSPTSDGIQELNTKMSETEDSVDKYQKISASLDALKGKTQLTNKEQEEFYKLRKDIVSGSLALQTAYGKEGEKISSVGDAAKIATDELAKLEKKQRDIAALKVPQDILNYQNKKNQIYSTVGAVDSWASNKNTLGYITTLSQMFTKDSKTGILPHDTYNLTFGELTKMREDLIAAQNDPEFYSIVAFNGLAEQLGEYFETIEQLISTKSSEVEALAEEFKGIIHDMLLGFTDLDGEAISGIMDRVAGVNWGNMSTENIKNFLVDYSKVFTSTYEEIMSEEMQNMIMDLMFNAFETYGDMSNADVAPLIDLMNDYIENAFTKDGMKVPYSFELKPSDEDELDIQVNEFKKMLQEDIDNAFNESWQNAAALTSIMKRLDEITPSTHKDETMNVSEILAGVNAINEITDVLNRMDSGEYDESIISQLIDDFPMLNDYMNESGTAIEACSIYLDYLIVKYGEVAKAMGIVIDEQKDFNEQVLDSIAPIDNAQKAMDKLRKGDALTVKEIAELSKEYPELNKELSDYAKNTKNTAGLLEALNKEYKNKAAQDFANSIYDAIDAVDKAKEGTLDYNIALENLGQLFTGGFADISSLDFAVGNLDSIRAAINGDIDAFHRLQEAAWVHISGSSDVDFSAVNNGIAIVGENSQRMAKWLESLGLFTTETATATADITLPTIEDGGLTDQRFTTGATYTLLKPAKSNPFTAVGGKSSGGSSGGGGGSGGKSGGGGGGGSSNISVSKKTSKLIDKMAKTHESYDNKLKITDLKREYHDIRGELQGVIGYTEIEADIIEDQNRALVENIAALEKQMKAKEKTIAKTKSSSKAHKQAAVDLEELNKTHQEYSELLLENKNRLEEIEKELKEFREQARQSAISVQDLIRSTIEEYEQYERDMLDGTVSLQDLILEVIQARYEKERDLAIETAEAKKEALREEIDAIDDLINKRRELIEEEEEAEEIAELEAKIARISADPTRRKELLELQEQLSEKRKEQAWKTYEEEMSAQKESLEDQIDSLDEYIEYVNDYYEDLLENPEKLIAEMKEVIEGTDAEIIAWLKSNMDEFSAYTDEKKEQTIRDWQEMIDQMRGVTETYKEQIEAVMNMTDEEIIAWLKKYNVEFSNATKEQQESFIYSWEQTLEEWRKAYEEVASKVSTYDYKSGSKGSSSSGSGSSSSKSSGTSSSSNKKSTSSSVSGSYKWKDSASKWNTAYATGTTEANALLNAFEAAKKKSLEHWKTKTGPGVAQAIQLINSATFNNPGNYFKEYKLGGMNYDTGWHWLDGTKTKPERILSSYQTQLFEDLIETLHVIKTFNVRGIASSKAPEYRNGVNGLNIETIEVNVAKLDDDADYREIAERVGEVLKDEIIQTFPIGGISL